MSKSDPKQAAMDESLMRRCLALAREAQDRGDAPVGSVVAREGVEIAAAAERVDSAHDIAGHAEVLAVRAACRALETLDLRGCTFYTTAEPCFMCSYAIRQTGIGRVVIGTPVPDVGGATSRYPILTAADIPGWPPPPVVVFGVLAGECRALFARETA